MTRCKAAILFLFGADIQGQIWLYHDNPVIATEKRQLPREKFVEPRLRVEASFFLDASQFVPFGQAIFGTGRELLDYVPNTVSAGNVENYFDRLRHSFRKGLRKWPRLAMVLKIGPTALLRIREKGRVKEILLTPEHPPPGLDLGYEILDIAGSLCGPRRYCDLVVFVRKADGAIRQQDLEAIGRRLCEVDSSIGYLIYARPDSWFLEHPSFPFLYAFDEGYRLPDPKTWQPAPEEWSIWHKCQGAKDEGKPN